jgi:proteasome-associated ATPase
MGNEARRKTGVNMTDEKEQEENLFLAEIPDVTWNDIAGQDEAKMQMIEAIEMPFKHKDLFEAYGKSPTKGILLSGPPGCGKTMLGKAAANSLAKIRGDSAAKASFFYVKGPQLLSKWVGSAEKNVRILFEKAREHKRQHGYPALIFIDEADSILPNRDSVMAYRTAETVVAAFLTEMDGMQDSAAVVVLATNRPEAIDPAIVREGRIDRKVAVSRPSVDDGAKIICLNLERSKISKGSTHKELAKHAAKAVYSSRRVYYSVDTAAGKMSLTLAHLVNGAMLAAVVDTAISLAIHRDIKNGGVSGISRADLIAAVDAIDRQNRALNHDGAISLFIETLTEKPIAIKRASFNPKVKRKRAEEAASVGQMAA